MKAFLKKHVWTRENAYLLMALVAYFCSVPVMPTYFAVLAALSNANLMATIVCPYDDGGPDGDGGEEIPDLKSA